MKRAAPPPLNALRTFEVFARHRSMTRAADELCVTHGAVSRRVTKLADDLGLTLVEPAGRGLRVTDDGRLLASSMGRALALIHDAIDTLQARDAQRPVVLSCERSIAMRWLIPRLSRFQDRHPDIELHLSVGGGPLDFARDQVALALRRLDFPVHPDWIVTPLMAERMGPVMAPSLLPAFEAGDYVALSSRTRPRACRARWSAMYLAHVSYGWPLERVGHAFGLNRATASTACRWAEDARDDDRYDAVMDGLDVEQSGIQRMEQLEGRIPGLSFQPFGQSGLNSPVMRGLTANFNTFSTSVLMLVDGVPTLTAQGFENSFLDIDRIEVLRGPQSTLYGRNAEAGVVSIHSLPMDDAPRAAISGEFASRNKRAGSFVLSHPIIENTLYGSISGSWSSQDGFIKNTYTDRKDDRREHGNINLGLRWTPTADTDVVIRYARQEFHDGSALWGSPTAERNEVASGTAGWNKSVGQTLSLNASHRFESGLTLRSITAYNDYRDRIQQDTDFMPIDALHVGRDHHFRNLSQELRLEGKTGKTDWLAGIYVDKQDNDLVNISKLMTGSNNLNVSQKGSSLALFSHWNIPLSDDWTLSMGGRIERNNVSIRKPDGNKMSAGWTHFSPKLALQFQINADNQWYVSVSKGVRSGGFNVVSPAVNFMPYSPERTLSYETGLKGSFHGHRGRYSIAAYYMNVKNMQVMQMPFPGMMYITSAASADSKGVELDVEYLLAPGWRVNAGLAWNRIRFDRFSDGAADYSGKRNPFAGPHRTCRHPLYVLQRLVCPGRCRGHRKSLSGCRQPVQAQRLWSDQSHRRLRGQKLGSLCLREERSQ